MMLNDLGSFGNVRLSGLFKTGEGSYEFADAKVSLKIIVKILC